MTHTTMHQRIKRLIEDTHEAFESSGSVNTDYAGFASMALPDFKTALDRPELTGHELRGTIRRGFTSHRAENPEGCWASFIAQYVVARYTNNNVN